MTKHKCILNSLFGQFFFAGIILLIIMLVDVFVMNRIVNGIIRETNIESNTKIMQQIDAKTKEFYNSICNIVTLISYEQTSYNYFTQDYLSRINNYDDLISILSNTMLIQEDIAGIAMYDSDVDLIAYVGKKFDLFYNIKEVNTIEFSDMFRPNSMSNSYYVVYYPVFDLKNQNYDKQIGMIVLLMKTNKFATFLQDAQITNNSTVYLLDTQNSIIACEGKNKADILSDERMESNKKQYVNIIEQKETGWQIVSIIPTDELTSGMFTVKKIFTITFIVIFIAVILLLYFCYMIILLPLRNLDLFVMRSAGAPFERAKISGVNEISKLSSNLNHMLDERDTMNEQLRQSQRQIYEIELAKKQIQILVYRNQINPHFLYNTFDCIRAMALYYDVEDIADITMALSKVFRYAVKGDNVVKLEEEINYIREYAKIINYRFAGKIKVLIEVEEELLSRKMIKLILQPIVENSVFHGLEQKIEDGQVTIKVIEMNGRIKFTITDNGCGMEQAKIDQIFYHMTRHSLNKSSENDSIGLMNIYQRLHLFYGDEVEFLITGEAGVGTTVTIVIPDTINWSECDV